MPSPRVLLRVTVDELPNFDIDADSAVERDAWTWLLKPWGPETPYKQLVRITFGFRFEDDHPPSAAVLAAATKPLLATMVELAWIYGDGASWVKSVTYEGLDDGEPRTVVTVTAAEGGGGWLSSADEGT